MLPPCFLSAVFSLLCSEHAIIVAYWRTGNILILPVLPRVFFSQVTNVMPNASTTYEQHCCQDWKAG